RRSPADKALGWRHRAAGRRAQRARWGPRPSAGSAPAGWATYRRSPLRAAAAMVAVTVALTVAVTVVVMMAVMARLLRDAGLDRWLLRPPDRPMRRAALG